jgi:LPS export ABC transporter protein LptC
VKLPVAVIGALALAACNKASGPPLGAIKNALADSADQILFGAKFTITDQGLRRAEVEGDTAYFFNSNTRIVLHPMHAKFYSSNGAFDGIASSREGTYDTRLATLEAKGDVVINSLDGKRLETPFARYDQRLDLISSESTFYMSEPSRDARGKGFKSDASLNSFSVTTLISSKSGKVQIPQE